MKSIFILLQIFLLLGSVKAQDIVFTGKLHPELNYEGLTGKVSYRSYIQIKGSPFFNDDWTPGKVYLENGDTLTDVQIKFDFYSHQLMAYQEMLRRVIIADYDAIKGFEISVTGIPHNFEKAVVTRTRAMSAQNYYLETVTNGTISLKKLYYCNVVALSSPEMPYLDEFDRNVEYQLKTYNEFENINLRKSALLHKFPQFKSEIKQFVRAEGLHLKKEADFARTIEFIDAIY